jgi:diguanylate cyclase (GGDEF)-like protein
MACVHNYFEVLWCGPAITLVIVSAFVNQDILRKMFLYCFSLEALAFLISIGEHPEELSFRLQNLIVAFMVTIFAYGLIKLVQKYYLKILEATKDLAEEKLQAEHNFHYDYLTGVYSRAHFMESAERMLAKSPKARHIGVAMMDIDDFKKINDTYGHEYGDIVLKDLGDLLQNTIHGYGITGRYGGEEFTILLLDQPSAVYDQLLEKIRADFENIHYSFTDQKITLSIGLVESSNTATLEDMISSADEALYQAKREGKNRVNR